MTQFFFVSILLHFTCADAFVPKCSFDSGACRSPTSLFGISEWRKENTGSELLLLPTSLDKMMVPGQSRFVVVEEESLMGMLTSAIDDNNSIIGTMISVGDDYSKDFLKIVPLCEISHYSQDNTKHGTTGYVNLKCVGRAKLKELKQVKPFLIGHCQIVVDEEWGDVHSAAKVLNDVKELISKSSTPQKWATYQQTVPLALEALESLLTWNDPINSQTIKELEAASWAATSTLQSKTKSYEALATRNLFERLQMVLRSTMEECYSSATTTSKVPGTNEHGAGFE